LLNSPDVPQAAALPTPQPGSLEPPRVLIVQTETQDSPAFLATWLAAQGVPFALRNAELGHEVPSDAAGWQAIAMLGGPMSVHDDLPFLPCAHALLHSAVRLGVPVLGHCLGGQMLAKVLGAPVSDNPVPEIGWSHIQRHDHPLARAWLGDASELPVFQWHFQTFGLPAGATLLAGNAACLHQAFALGPHLGMQFHIEVDAEKLGRWCAEAPAAGDALTRFASVQTPDAMRADTTRHLSASQATAARMYTRWLTLAGALKA